MHAARCTLRDVTQSAALLLQRSCSGRSLWASLRTECQSLHRKPPRGDRSCLHQEVLSPCSQCGYDCYSLCGLALMQLAVKHAQAAARALSAQWPLEWVQ